MTDSRDAQRADSLRDGRVRESFGRLCAGVFIAVLILALVPWTSQPTGHVKVLWYQLGAALAAMGWAAGGVGPNWRGAAREPLALLFLSFVALNAAAVAASLNPLYSAMQWTRLAALLAIFLGSGAWLRSSDRVWSACRWVCWAMAAASVYGFGQHFGYDPFPWDTELAERFGFLKQGPSTLGNPNVASHALVLAIVLASGLALGTRNWVYWGVAALFVAHLGLTHTRGALLALGAAAALGVMAAIARRMFVGSGMRTYAPVAGLAVLAVLLASAAMAASTITRGAGAPFDDSIVLRYHAFHGAARMAQAAPLLGYGPGGYELANPPFWSDHEQRVYAEQGLFNDHVHNEPLEFAVEAGLPASVLFCAILLIAVLRNLRHAAAGGMWALRLMLAAFFAAFFVDGLFGFNFHAPVSGVLCAAALGATVGLETSAGPVKLGWVTRTVLAITAVLLATVATLDFAGELIKQRGRGALQKGAPEYAADAFARATKLKAYDWTSWYLRGRAAIALGKTDQAIEHFEAALDRNPNHVPALLALGRSGLSQASNDSAVALDAVADTIEKARRLSPYSAEAHDLTGRLEMLRASRGPNDDSGANADIWARAEAAFERASELAGEMRRRYIPYWRRREPRKVNSKKRKKH